jgi:hypothetical protein
MFASYISWHEASVVYNATSVARLRERRCTSTKYDSIGKVTEHQFRPVGTPRL